MMQNIKEIIHPFAKITLVIACMGIPGTAVQVISKLFAGVCKTFMLNNITVNIF